MPARDRLGDADGVLVGLGAAEGEKRLLDVSGKKLSELLAEPRPHLGGHGCRVHVLELGRLLGDRLGHPAVAVADVHAHEL